MGKFAVNGLIYEQIGGKEDFRNKLFLIQE